MCLLLACCLGLVGFQVQLAGAEENYISNTRLDHIRSAGTVEYHGMETQARVQSTSLVKSERRVQGDTITYDLSVVGGLRIGYHEELAGFEYAPFTLERNRSTEQLTSTEQGVMFSLSVINETIRQVPKRTMREGEWEEKIYLALSEYFPPTLGLKFAVQTLQVYDVPYDVLLITIESDLLKYQVAEEGRDNGTVNARYKAVLVYSPAEDLLYQAAAKFMAIHGEELIRFENLQFLTDETGEKPLFPLVDVSEYLGFVQKPLELKKEGSLPMWAVQSTRVFDVINTAAMTAAEQSTNPSPLAAVGGSLWRSIRDTAHWLYEHVMPEAARDFLRSFKVMDDNFSKWLADLAKYRADINTKALDLASTALTVSTAFVMLPAPVAFLVGVAGTALTLYYMQNQFAQIEQGIMDLMKGPGKIAPFPPGPPKPTPPPPSPPPVEVKKPPKGGGGLGDIFLIAAVGVAAVGVAYYVVNAMGAKQMCCDPGERICNGYAQGLGKWICCPESRPLLGDNGRCYTWFEAPSGVTTLVCRPGRCVDTQ